MRVWVLVGLASVIPLIATVATSTAPWRAWRARRPTDRARARAMRAIRPLLRVDLRRQPTVPVRRYRVELLMRLLNLLMLRLQMALVLR